MTFSFLIYNYFPYGGQQRDFLRISSEILARGHSVDVYTMSWTGEVPRGMNIIEVPKRGYSRLSRYRNFTQWIQSNLVSKTDGPIIGFNKMPGLDIYFAADPCFLTKARTQRGAYYKYTSRYRHFRDYELSVFGPLSKTQVLVLTPQQRDDFEHCYPGCQSRLHLLPAGISEDRKVLVRDRKRGQHIRDALNLKDDTQLILQLGSGFKVKGVDRSLKAIGSLNQILKSNCHYLLIGEDRANKFVRLSKQLGISDKVTIWLGRDDVPQILQAADLLLHPAYSESAGYVLLEATIAGLPVLTTASCGYAFHIERAASGEVCSSPFSQQDLNVRLKHMLEQLHQSSWSANGLQYGHDEDLYSMANFTADHIESFSNAERAEAL
ncbi:MAG: UDP-glucose:(heptosyl)LPS alpha-1,3-glucosyltransferase [Pseudohongiellaceae bacterium]|jgi:UDP-glucose:(heptosyl)LPS alpha-1,3-glucosyltransferase